jgi:putative transposase
MIKINLSKKDREFLTRFIKKGTVKARAIARANVLLLSDEGHSEEYISKATKVHRQTIWRTKKRYLEVGLPQTLHEKPRSGQPKKYDEKDETEIIALACTKAPNGRNRWTVRLLTEELKKKKEFESINRESVRLILKKARLSLG